MVKFLLEHAVELDEKGDDLPHSWHESPASLFLGSTHLERSRVTQSIIADMQNVDSF
jgi:hypothetical protein